MTNFYSETIFGKLGAFRTKVLREKTYTSFSLVWSTQLQLWVFRGVFRPYFSRFLDMCAIELVFTCTVGVRLLNLNPVPILKIKHTPPGSIQLRCVVWFSLYEVMPSIPIGRKLWTCASYFGAIGIIFTYSFVNIFDVCVLFWRERKCNLSSIPIPSKKVVIYFFFFDLYIRHWRSG